MTAESFLSSLVEVAIGLAGFAGIIAAIRHRGVSTWPPAQRILLQSLFGAAAAAITFALLPAFLAESGLATASIWRVGSTLLFVWLVGISVFRHRQSARLDARLPFKRAFLVWVAVIMVIQAVNSIALAASWAYLLGVFSLIVNAFVFFMVLLLGPSNESENAT